MHIFVVVLWFMLGIVIQHSCTNAILCVMNGTCLGITGIPLSYAPSCGIKNNFGRIQCGLSGHTLTLVAGMLNYPEL